MTAPRWIASLLCTACFWPLSFVRAEEHTKTRRALLVGVWDYSADDKLPPHTGHQDYWRNLNSHRDVEHLKALLTSDKFKFDSKNITALTSKSQTIAAGIREAFAKLIDESKPGDSIYIHYSGHGTQVKDDNGDEIDGKEEAIVPSDMFGPDGIKENYIRDDEIGAWLDQLKAKSPASLFVSFDSCHSGNASRDGALNVRGRVADEVAAMPSAAATRGENAPTGFLAKSNVAGGYVFLSACRSEQRARETFGEDNRAMGLMTWAMVRAFAESTPDTTYRDLIERITIQMAQKLPDNDQVPQLEADEFNTKLFSGDVLKVQPYLTLSLINEKLFLNAGEIQGMTVGSTFALYDKSVKDFKSAKPIATAKIDALEMAIARLKFNEKIDPQTLIDARAIEIEHNYGNNALAVNFSKLPDAALVEEFKKLPLVKSVDGENYDIAFEPAPVTRGAAAVRLNRVNGAEIGIFELDPKGRSALEETLKRESRSKFFSRLEQSAGNGKMKIEIKLIPVDVVENSAGQLRKVVGEKAISLGNGQTELKGGEWFQIAVRNTGYQDVYVTILNLDSKGNVSCVWPASSRSQEKVINDGEWHSIMGSKNAAIKVVQPFGQEMYKAIATLDPVDFRSAIGQAERSGSEPINNPIARLFESAVHGTRSGETSVAAPEDWATHTLVIRTREAAKE